MLFYLYSELQNIQIDGNFHLTGLKIKVHIISSKLGFEPVLRTPYYRLSK